MSNSQEVLANPGAATQVFLNNYLELRETERAAHEWLQSMWQEVENLLLGAEKANGAKWTFERATTVAYPQHGIILRSPDFVTELKRFAPAGTKIIVLSAMATDARVHTTLRGSHIRLDVTFSSGPACKAVANAHASRPDRSAEFQAALTRLRKDSPISVGGDAWVERWEIPLELSGRDPLTIANLIESRFKTAWESLLAPLLAMMVDPDASLGASSPLPAVDSPRE